MTDISLEGTLEPHMMRVADLDGLSSARIIDKPHVAGVWAASPGEAPRILVHLFERADLTTAEAVETRAGAMGAFWFGEPVPVEFVHSMISLVDRPLGSFAHPPRP